jgi:hypothetical protein
MKLQPVHSQKHGEDGPELILYKQTSYAFGFLNNTAQGEKKGRQSGF